MEKDNDLTLPVCEKFENKEIEEQTITIKEPTVEEILKENEKLYNQLITTRNIIQVYKSYVRIISSLVEDLKKAIEKLEKEIK